MRTTRRATPPTASLVPSRSALYGLLLGLPLVLVAAACAERNPAEGGESDTSGDGDGDGDSGDEACEAAGSLLPGARPTPPPSQTGNPVYTCTNGWGTDAPPLDASWSVRMIDSVSEDFFAPGLLLEAHPSDGVVAYGPGVIAHYDAGGELQWGLEGVTETSQVLVGGEDAGTLLVAIYDYNNDSSSFARYSGGGELLEQVPVPWNEPQYGNIWGLETFGSNIVLGVFDADSQGNYEETLLYLDSAGTELLRRSTTLFGALTLAVNESGNALFGASPGFVVSLDNGAVLGQVQPSAGFGGNFVGVGESFYGAVSANSDLSIGGYSSVGAEQWLQGYDRATLFDRAGFIDGRDGVVVATGTVGSLNLANTNFYNTQPMIIAADLDGNALWQDRIDARGEALGVAVSADGSVYVSGLAEEDGDTVFRWLRKYEP